MKKNVTGFQGKTGERKAPGSLNIASVLQIRTGIGFNVDSDTETDPAF
jgi:hypothetical protein